MMIFIDVRKYEDQSGQYLDHNAALVISDGDVVGSFQTTDAPRSLQTVV